MRIIQRGAARFGHRGILLILIGILWMGVGIGIEFDPPNRTADVFVLHELLPTWLRIILWTGTGLFAVTTGIRGRRIDDSNAYAAIMLMPLERCLSYLVSWVMLHVTTLLNEFLPVVPVLGFDRGWYAALIWVVIVVLLAVVASWRNPDQMSAAVHDREA